MWQGPGLSLVAETGNFVTTDALSTIFLLFCALLPALSTTFLLFCALILAFFSFSPSLSRYGYSTLFVFLRLHSTRSCHMPTLWVGGVHYMYQVSVNCKQQVQKSKKKHRQIFYTHLCIHIYALRFKVQRVRTSTHSLFHTWYLVLLYTNSMGECVL